MENNTNCRIFVIVPFITTTSKILKAFAIFNLILCIFMMSYSYEKWLKVLGARKPLVLFLLLGRLNVSFCVNFTLYFYLRPVFSAYSSGIFRLVQLKTFVLWIIGKVSFFVIDDNRYAFEENLIIACFQLSWYKQVEYF